MPHASGPSVQCVLDVWLTLWGLLQPRDIERVYLGFDVVLALGNLCSCRFV